MRRTLLIAALVLTALALSAIPATTGNQIASETIDPACAEWNSLPASLKKIIPPPPNCSIGEDVEPIGSSIL